MSWIKAPKSEHKNIKTGSFIADFDNLIWALNLNCLPLPFNFIKLKI